MSNHQINFTKEADECNLECGADSFARRLTLPDMPPKLSSLSLKRFSAFNTRRGASEKRNDMAVVASFGGISIEIIYGYPTPTFFAIAPNGQAVIEILTLNVNFNTLSQQQLQAVLHWARNRTAALAREWSKANLGLPVGRIV